MMKFKVNFIDKNNYSNLVIVEALNLPAAYFKTLEQYPDCKTIDLVAELKDYGKFCD